MVLLNQNRILKLRLEIYGIFTENSSSLNPPNALNCDDSLIIE